MGLVLGRLEEVKEARGPAVGLGSAGILASPHSHLHLAASGLPLRRPVHSPSWVPHPDTCQSRGLEGLPPDKA